jgi:N-acetylmuramoyl-L-alanine amidase
VPRCQIRNVISILLQALVSSWPVDSHSLIASSKVHPTQKIRIAIDAGHGAPNNNGNHGCFCHAEMGHTLVSAKHVAFVLSALGFEVKLLRGDSQTPRYLKRIQQAEAFKADVIVSFHSDVRGEAFEWEPYGPGISCWRNDDARGFAILWSEDGEPNVVSKRQQFGRLMGSALTQAGFPAYSGEDYGYLYRQDPVELSGFIDIRPRKKSVYFLRASKIPTLIIETHHALDPLEVLRFEETKTLDVMAYAIAQATIEFTSHPTSKSGN